MSKTYHGKYAFFPSVRLVSLSKYNFARFFKVVILELFGFVSLMLTGLLAIILAQSFLLPVIMIASAFIACAMVVSMTLFFLPQLIQSKPNYEKNK